MKTKESRKSFVDIHEDYAFFLAHSNEPAACRRQMLDILAGLHWNTPVRLLDFGCGGGEFLEQLLQQWNIPRENLRLALVEVDPLYLKTAESRVKALAGGVIETGASLAALAGHFDVISSNHVLYYVPDLETTLRQFSKKLAKQGTGILILGGKQNQLCRLWEMAFAGSENGVPYFLAEDVESKLRELSIPFQKKSVHSTLRFPDRLENRLKILRFLFAGELEKYGRQKLVDQMDLWSQNGDIVMENQDLCFVFRQTR